MAPLTMLFGVLLIVLGLAGFGYGLYTTGDPARVVTALIPAAAGVLLFVLGVLARREAMRKHAMHAAAAVGLIGCVAAAVQVGRRALSENFEWGPGTLSQAAMAVLCGLFVALCVKSFIDARRARAQQGAEP